VTSYRPLLLNLGCGTRTSSAPNVVNIDWSIYLRIRRSRFVRPLARCLLDAPRRETIEALGDNILVHDLRKGIPFRDRKVDAVYHSHLLEHLDREAADPFMREVYRVLCPGGLQRIVVPDLEGAVRSYLAHLEAGSPEEHDRYVGAIIEQSIRRAAHGTSTKKPLRRTIETLLLGDARRRGETHQWMYDVKNLTALVERSGFVDVRRSTHDRSSIPGWDELRLDYGEGDAEYKPGSLYLECAKPSLP